MIQRLAMMSAVTISALLLGSVVLPTFAIAQWTPDLVALAVIAFAFSDGPETGARYGFAAGLAADLLAGPDQLIGQGALVLTLIGYAAGLARPFLSSEPMLSRAAAVGMAAVVSVVGHGLLGVLLEVREVTIGEVLRGALIVGVYSAVIAPLILRPVAALTTRFSGLAVSGALTRRG